MIVENAVFGCVRYKIAYPENFDKSKKYPVLFFMHGAGERGDNLDLVEVHGVFYEIKKGREFDFICIAPQCEKEIVWFDKLPFVKEFICNFIENEYVDKKRVFLSGISMGGYMSWQLLMSLPDIFKKAIICCGGGMYWNADKIKTEVWAVHGLKDRTVFVEESIKMVNAVLSNGGKAKLTILENAEHNCWTATFQEQEVYDWLML